MSAKISADAMKTITNELQGGSVFFRKALPKGTPTDRKSEPVGFARRSDSATDRTGEATGNVNRSENQSVLPTGRQKRPDRPTDRKTVKHRPTQRHGFEFYADQLHRLKLLQAQKMIDLGGETVSLSELVREAIEVYLDVHLPTKPTGSTNRPQK
jgi:hypothetical protein